MMISKPQFRNGLLALVVAGVALSSVNWLRAGAHLESERAEKKHAYEMEEIMKIGNRGDKDKGIDSLLKKTLDGAASVAEKKKLLGYYLALEEFAAPKGDQKAWATKTGTLTMAMVDVLAGKDGAADRLKEASNCKACHSEHRPD